MGLDLKYIKGQTPLDEEEKEGLKIKTISTVAELNEFEQQNIEKAEIWIYGKVFSVDKVLDEAFIKSIHKRMLGDVWKWAGNFRSTNKNIGVDKAQIQIELRKLIDDCKFWIKNDRFPSEEIAIRFKHRLVSIHLFPNGNGRHSRILGNLLAVSLGKDEFSWGRANLVSTGNSRTNYISALKKADNNEIEPLLKFARS
ncbi:MAG: mobile mystery protein B [Saprospiraceae bacterium]|nr:mobile mystery protein B [Saprospiraceae bacterium]